MRRVAGSAVIISLFVFLLSLPLLHLHPGGVVTFGAVIHWHMTHAADVHIDGTAANPILNGADSHDGKAVPFEISSLCAASAVQAPVSDFLATLPAIERILPQAPFVSFREPDPRAQAPPGLLIHLSFRSPPA
jgi:hypothetical protein